MIAARAQYGDVLNLCFPGEHFFEYKNDVLAIVRHHRCLYDAEEIKVHLTKTFADEDVICAVSLTFYDIGRIRSFYKQCLFLLESGRAENRASQVRFYGNAFFKHFINEYNIDRNFAWLINPKIDLLRVYDDQHNTKLVECLKTYIECGFSKKRTAQKLSIHYNTLTYRLGRIKEIAMIDLEGERSILGRRTLPYSAVREADRRRLQRPITRWGALTERVLRIVYCFLSWKLTSGAHCRCGHES